MKLLHAAALSSSLIVLGAAPAARAEAPAARPRYLHVADAVAAAPGDGPAPMAAAATPAVAEKSPNVAVALSLGVTLGGAALIAANAALLDATANPDEPGGSATPGWFYVATTLGALAVVAGPSAGHVYVGKWGHALAFTGLRAGALVLGVGVAALSEGDADSPLLYAGIGGVAVAAGLAVIDVVDSARAARRFNARARAEAGLTASVVPTYDPQRRAGGLALAGTF